MGFQGVSISTQKETVLKAFNGFVGLNVEFDFGYLVKVVDNQGNPNTNAVVSSSQTFESKTDENGVAYIDLQDTDTIEIRTGVTKLSYNFDVNTKGAGQIELVFDIPTLLF